ncbi:M24 family metallopeptidase [Neomoorella mulderi]|uniref:Xaa-Pro dipeptidase n=1 Tax=Moorella mulderi DSM 14980 TaxID=1122241 RepID=A0A151AUA7_9FIRM|nr:Xaa-Pro peptidase family protein [Moorella mulderi]KYH31236.1 Xaa-Pro dipeptidase [Moorella mulderi DSM 14980]
MTTTEYKERLKRFQEALQARELDGALIFQAADLYYLSGTAQSCHLFVPATGEPLLLAYRDTTRAQAEAALNQVLPLSSFKEIPGLLAGAGWSGLKRLGLEMDVIPLSLFRRYQELFPDCQWVDISKILRSQRMLKSSIELEALRYAADRHAEVFKYISSVIRPGMTELEIAAEFEGYARRLGHQGTKRFRGQEQGMIPGIVAAGANSALASCFDIPLAGQGLTPLYPLGPSRHRWEAGEPLLIDYAGVYGDYTVDQTRIYLDADVAPVLQKAQEVAMEIAARVAEKARPGVTAGELYDLAVKMASRAGLGEHFMGHGRQVSYIGHGIGLELNEWPVIARGDQTVLATGMAFALEPKFVFPGQGSAGVEDTYVVTENGAVSLTY